MSYGISLHVWGDYACFTRPELKAERMSYEVMTPSAARGILSAIYWKPQFRWVIDRIHVLRPIRLTQIRRNEVGAKAVAPSSDVMAGRKEAFVGLLIEDNRQQRAATILRDVGYIIDAHVEVLEEEPEVNSVAKHLEMFKRRAAKGQCFHQPCLGNREFPAAFALVDDEHPALSELTEAQKNRSFGLMLWDMVYMDDKKGNIICAHTRKRQTASPRFFLAEMVDGIIKVPAQKDTLS